MKKLKLLKLGIIFTMILGLVAAGEDFIWAKDGVTTKAIKGWVETSVGEVNEKGGSASITYTFKVANGNLTSVQGQFNWDASKMEIDSVNSDNSSNWSTGAGQLYIQSTDGTKAPSFYVTLNFKNVLPSGNGGDSVPITFTFDDSSSPMEPGVTRWEFADGSFDLFQPSEVSMFNPSDSQIIMNLPVGVSITPATATVSRGNTQKFESTVTNDDGSGVTWKVDSSESSIDADGLLSVGANESKDTLTITAISKKDSTKSATATVSVSSKPALTLAITPNKTDVFKGEASEVKFSATPSVSDKTTVSYSVSGNTSSATTIDAKGVLKIAKDETADKLVILATAKNSETQPTVINAEATVNLVEVSVAVTPDKVTVPKGSSKQFEAKVTNDLNKAGVTWEVDGTDSKINENGLLVIGLKETKDTLTVTAVSKQDKTKKATSVVSVGEALPIEIALDIKSVDVKQGGTQMFTAVVDNDGGAGVTWEVIGARSKDTKIMPQLLTRGLVSKAQLVVGADEALGEIKVKVTSIADPTKSATAIVNVTKKTVASTPSAKPSTSPSTSTSGGVRTADTTNRGLLLGFAGLSLVAMSVLVVNKKRRSSK